MVTKIKKSVKPPPPPKPKKPKGVFASTRVRGFKAWPGQTAGRKPPFPKKRRKK